LRGRACRCSFSRLAEHFIGHPLVVACKVSAASAAPLGGTDLAPMIAATCPAGPFVSKGGHTAASPHLRSIYLPRLSIIVPVGHGAVVRSRMLAVWHRATGSPPACLRSVAATPRIFPSWAINNPINQKLDLESAQGYACAAGLAAEPIPPATATKSCNCLKLARKKGGGLSGDSGFARTGRPPDPGRHPITPHQGNADARPGRR
jgi:hypothetical protein